MSPLAGLQMHCETTGDVVALARVKLILSRLDLLFNYIEATQGPSDIISDDQALENLTQATVTL